MAARPHSEFTKTIVPLCAVRFLCLFKDTLFCTFFMFLAMGSTTFVTGSCMMLLFAASAGIPALLFFIPAGLMADHVPKRYVILLSLFADLILSGVALFVMPRAPEGMWTGFLTFMALFCTIRAFFMPGFLGIMPETFQEENLSRANGLIAFWVFAGTLAGVIMSASLSDPLIVLICCLVLSFLTFSVAFKIKFTIPARKNMSVPVEILAGIRDLFTKPSLLLSAAGENLFIAIGTIIPFLLLLCLCDKVGAGNVTFSTSAIALSAPMIGFAFGSYFAGKVSSKKIEPGLVPFGALGVAVMLFLAQRFYGPVWSLDLADIPGLSVPIRFALPVCGTLFLLLAGICGGFFVIPLHTYLQHRLKAETRGMSLATHQAFGVFFMAIFTWLLFRLQTGTMATILPENLLPATGGDLVQGGTILTTLGIFLFAVTLITMWLLPDFALRFMIISLCTTFYKIRITGAENIPQHGPALLLSNHVSFVDNVLLCACTSRRIRFLIQEQMLRHASIRLLARLTKFILVPNTRKGLIQMFENVQNALRAGDIICVFPEGLPTRNSVMGEFKAGYRKMIPADMNNVPIIPVHIGDMWGSKFSYFSMLFKHRLPLRSEHSASVTFGEPLPRNVQPYEVRRRIAELAADTVINNPRDNEYPLHVQVAYNAKKSPFRKVTTDADGKTFSIFKIFLGSLLLSRALRKIFTQDEEYVGVMMPNCTVSIIALLSVLYADKVPCSLNFTTPRNVLDLTVQKAGIKHIITSHKFLAKIEFPESDNMIFLEDLMPQITFFKKIVFMLAAALIPTNELMNLVSPLSREDLNRTATVLFSSGSTGNPKGIVLTHHNINSDVHAMTDMIAQNPDSDAILGNLPLFHSFGMSVCFWIPLSQMIRITYLISPLDATLTGKVIERDKLSIMVATPSFLQTYIRKCKAEQFATIRIVITGAEKLRTDIADRFHEFIGKRITILEGYGCTELAPVATINVPRDISDLGRIVGKKGSIGPALNDTSIKVVDPLSFKELPPGSEGLMFVRGPMVMQGYLNQPEETKKALVDGYYNTGDIITMDNSGYVTICGRLSRFSKIAGEMVPHEMVECIINELCKTESRVVAVGSIPDAQKGEALLVLYTPEMPMTPDEVVADLRERSISNLWIPKAANFYPVEKLPILGTGKLDLTLLRTIAQKITEERAAAAAKK